MSARDRILARVRAAVEAREAVAHPGDFLGWRPTGEAGDADPVVQFRAAFEAAGGETVRVPDEAAAAAWLATLASSFDSVALGAGVPGPLRPDRPTASPENAALGVSIASAGVAETGSLLLDARDGRRAQLLPPTHVVLVAASRVRPTLRDALLAVGGDLPSAIGLHSGPSKSADIGQIMVKGVHGPGRVVAVVMG